MAGIIAHTAGMLGASLPSVCEVIIPSHGISAKEDKMLNAFAFIIGFLITWRILNG
jgi:hypothetical protein